MISGDEEEEDVIVSERGITIGWPGCHCVDVVNLYNASGVEFGDTNQGSRPSTVT